ncbi:MAG: hypothetical protein IPG02_20620 [Ignavibacteria bacterium]|nr:hypothetical protein [Ignavibacteria bacterium]
MKKLFLLAIILFYSNAQSNWTFVSTVPTSPNISSISVVDQNLIWVAATAGKSLQKQQMQVQPGC